MASYQAQAGDQPWTSEEKAELTRLWEIHGGKFSKIGKLMGRSRGSISGKSRVMGLQFKGGRATVLQEDHPALTEKRTIYPSRVIDPDNNVLKSGDNQRKLGPSILKGKWKGFAVYSLSLEERATCPTTCVMWRGCYANAMGHAKRYRHGPELEQQIVRELARLEVKHPQGFVVRLHIVGDFYSVKYVEFWALMLDLFPTLRIFGYSAWTSETQIGQAVAKLRNSQWDRFAVRTSGAKKGPRTVVFHARPPKGAIHCPAQRPTKKPLSCSSCALCWAPALKNKCIAFKAH